MALLLLAFVVESAVIVAAGLVLTRYADTIGRLTGLGGSLTGLVLLAAATSLPELAVDCSAVLIDAPDLAVGAVLGSSLLNLLILAIIDMGHHAKGRLFTPMVAAHALSATTSIVLTAIVLLFIILPGVINLPFPLVWQGVGLGTTLVTVSYLLFLRLIYVDRLHVDRQSRAESPEEQDDAGGSLRNAVIGYLASTAVIFAAAHFLAGTAFELAKATGLGETFVGTTLVALTTSLPEIVTTLAAVRMGAFEMAVGNIFGSNCFNMAILMPVDAFYQKGALLSNVSLAHAVTAAAVIIISGVAVAGLLYQPEKKYRFIEPDAALIVVLVIGALGLVYWIGAS